MDDTVARRILEHALEDARYDSADSRNLARLISKYADLKRVRELKVAAVTSLIDEARQCHADDYVLESVYFEVRKERMKIAVIVDSDDENESEMRDMWCTRFFDTWHHGCVMTGYAGDIAETIVSRVEDGGFCNLCGQLNLHLREYGVCRECAAHEMSSPCVYCSETMGRQPIGELIHPACKRRRLNAE